MKSRKAASILFTLIATGNASASGIDKALSVQNQTHKESAASQQLIDQSDARIQQLRAEIELLETEVKNLEVYQIHLTNLVASQEEEAQSLTGQINEIQATRQGIVPLMYYMLDGLKQFVEKDLPLKSDVRLERIAKLEKLMTKADVSDAEKYRLILEAYEIEAEYGSKLGVYSGQIAVGAETREVDVLHLGRITMVARSLDGQKYWYWSQLSRQWQVPQSAMQRDIDIAFDVAAKRVAPQMVTLPVSVIQSEVR